MKKVEKISKIKKSSILKNVFKESFKITACHSLLLYFNCRLYSDGVIPVFFLKVRQKYCTEEKTLCKEQSSKVRKGYFIRFFAFFSLTEVMYWDGEILYSDLN